MRTINVSTDVFSMIWSLRREGEETEDDILGRVLAIKPPPSNAAALKMEVPPREAELFGKVRWVDDIIAALRSLGGSASLMDIYDAVRVRRKLANRSVTREYQATIRRTLEDHSSDSANFRAENLFKLIERGVWALR